MLHPIQYIRRRVRRRGVGFIELALIFLFLGIPIMWSLFEFGLDTVDSMSIDRGVHSASTTASAGFTYNMVLPASVPNPSATAQSIANAARNAFEVSTGLTESSYHMRITMAYASPDDSSIAVYVFDYGDVDFTASWSWTGSAFLGPDGQTFPLRGGDRVICTEVYAEYPALFQTFTSRRYKRLWELSPT